MTDPAPKHNPFTTLLRAPATPSPESEVNYGGMSLTDEEIASLDLSGFDDGESTSPSSMLSVGQLADYDTDTIRELKGRADAMLARRELALLESPDEFRVMLDTLNSAMENDNRYDLFGMAATRNYVKSIMITLSKNPEFSSILLDSDVHNVIKFARNAFTGAQLEVEMKASSTRVKSASTKAKASIKAVKMDAMAKAMAQIQGEF